MILIAPNIAHRGNMEDALQKMQKYIDNAALEVQPIESDPEKRKKLAKQCAFGVAADAMYHHVRLCGG